MLSLIIVGISGKMGNSLVDIAQKEPSRFSIVSGITKNTNYHAPFSVTSKFEELSLISDVIIDFSHPAVLSDMLQYALNHHIPLVIATTGYSEDQLEQIKMASKSIPIFLSANMSVGINLLAELCKQASISLELNYDIEIVEKHHNRKLDAPSGTALLLADEINSVQSEPYHYQYNRHAQREPRPKNEIGIHSVRGGSIVGEHEVLFAGDDEVITLRHSASSRRVFALGALRAAEFIKEKSSGLYNMKDMLQINSCCIKTNSSNRKLD